MAFQNRICKIDPAMTFSKLYFSAKFIYRNALRDPKSNIILIYVPKVASTTWQIHILRNMGLIKGDEPYRDIKSIAREHTLLKKVRWPLRSLKVYRNSFVFAVVRDPIERFVSAHNMILTHNVMRDIMEKELKRPVVGPNFVNDVLDYLETTKNPDYHFRPQSDFLCAAKSVHLFGLNSPKLVRKLSEAGYAAWLDGFGSAVHNRSIVNPLHLTGLQITRLKQYYCEDYHLIKQHDVDFGEPPKVSE